MPPASDEGFPVRLRMVHDREFVVWYEGWQHTFDRAEDALGLLRVRAVGQLPPEDHAPRRRPVGWQVEKREYGMWVRGTHPRKRPSLAFWRPLRVVYRQNHFFPDRDVAARLSRRGNYLWFLFARRPGGQRGVHFGNGTCVLCLRGGSASTR